MEYGLKQVRHGQEMVAFDNFRSREDARLFANELNEDAPGGTEYYVFSDTEAEKREEVRERFASREDNRKCA